MMSSESKEVRFEQKGYWEHKLSQRLSLLASKGIESTTMAKDAAVRQLRAKIRETEGRLKVIEASEKKAEEMAQLKAEKKAAPRKEKGKKKMLTEEKLAMSKGQQKRKKK